MRIFSIAFLLSCLFVLHVKGQQLLEVNPDEEYYIGKNIGYYIDTTGTQDITAVAKKTFIPGQTDILNFGNIPYTVWLRFRICSKTERSPYMEIMNPLLEKIELYKIDKQQPAKLFSGGFIQKFKKRPEKVEDWVFTLHLTEQDTITYYLKVKSGFPLQMPVMVYSTANFVKSAQTHNLFWGIYMGIMLFAFFYNLFIYLSIREKVYFYYILYIFFSALFYLALEGYTFKLIWPDIPALNPLIPVIICITNVIITFFTIKFLQISKRQKALYYWGRASIVAFTLTGIYNIFGNYQIAAIVAQLLSIIYCIYLISAGVSGLRRNVPTAKYFLFAWTLFLFFVIIYLLTNFNIIPSNFFTTHCIFIGHMTEVLLLSFSLADRINWLQAENRNKQKEIIHQLKENELIQTKANLELEQKVKERTIEVIEQKNEAVRQTQISNELLLNILPEEVATELKETGKCHPKLIKEATVMFADIKDFSQLSEIVSPQELITELNECFSEFDRIIAANGLEKIKTIGDAYMAAGGVPIPDEDHVERIVDAALEIQKFVAGLATSKGYEGTRAIQLRIGIHTGPVIAGIVGIKKFAYDIWGDTVNIASRMESSGEAGKVNISESTYQLVKDRFNCTYRGKVNAKNKGVIDMYYVEGKIL
jgi:class 3 adenylate cyclase